MVIDYVNCKIQQNYFHVSVSPSPCLLSHIYLLYISICTVRLSVCCVTELTGVLMQSMAEHNSTFGH